METAFEIQPQQTKINKPARSFKEQTSKLPSWMLLWLSAGVISALVYKMGRQKSSNSFIGKWVAPLVLYGILNKLKKQVKRDLTEKV
jgi:hypothetical protein